MDDLYLFMNIEEDLTIELSEGGRVPSFRSVGLSSSPFVLCLYTAIERVPVTYWWV